MFEVVCPCVDAGTCERHHCAKGTRVSSSCEAGSCERSAVKAASTSPLRHRGMNLSFVKSGRSRRGMSWAWWRQSLTNATVGRVVPMLAGIATFPSPRTTRPSPCSGEHNPLVVASMFLREKSM